MAESRVGERSERISLYKRTETDDGQGGIEYGAPALVSTVWAKILRPKFWTANAQGGIGSAITQGITIRKRNDIELNWFVQYRGKMYEILHIDDSDSAETTLTCQAVVQRG